jgi:8-oxo-dGTP pyrophosphatase MutT (NUDIX family)
VPKQGRSRPVPVRDAVAAGGVVIRDRDGRLEVAIAGRESDGTWVFPKGTPDGNESVEETALREVAEETGLEVRVLAPLDTTQYWFASRGVRFHKRVHFFLMEATGGDVSRHDHEYDVVRWVPVDEARAMLSFENYRQMLDLAVAAWHQRRLPPRDRLATT